MTSLWARCRLKYPASRLFTQPFIQGADQRKHQSSTSLAFVRSPVNSPHKVPVTQKMFPFHNVIMNKQSRELMINRICLSQLGYNWFRLRPLSIHKSLFMNIPLLPSPTYVRYRLISQFGWVWLMKMATNCTGCHFWHGHEMTSRHFDLGNVTEL